jgi:hypothetical protein
MHFQMLLLDAIAAHGSVPGFIEALEERTLLSAASATSDAIASDNFIMAAVHRPVRTVTKAPALNFQAGAGSTLTAISAANGVSSATAIAPAVAPLAPPVAVTIPGLAASAGTSETLTSVISSISSEISLTSVIETSPIVIGSETNSTVATPLQAIGSGNEMVSAGEGTGIVSITGP